MPNLNVFRTSDAFSENTLTDSINKVPFVAGRAGRMGMFDEQGVPTTSIWLEEREQELVLVEDKPRGAPPQQFEPNKRTARPLALRHLPIEHPMAADQIQNVRQFGSPDQLMDLQTEINRRFARMAMSLDVTLEHFMIGALKGTVVDADGSTVLYNLFTEFEVSQVTEWKFNFAAAVGGEVLAMCQQVVRSVEDELGAFPMDHVHAFVSHEFMDAMVQNAEVRETYLRFRETQFLRTNHARDQFEWGGIVWEEYRGSVGGVRFIPQNKAIFFPVVDSALGLYKTYYGPADFMSTVNTVGLPRYARQWPWQDDRGITLHAQANPICIVTRPRVLQVGDLGA